MRIEAPMGSFEGREGLGKAGESLAERFLKRKGYEILKRNFKCRLGEIDLIAREGGEIVFVEVKSRIGTAFGFPEEQISRKKQRKLWCLSEFYLKRCPEDSSARIDVVSVLLDLVRKIDAQISLREY